MPPSVRSAGPAGASGGAVPPPMLGIRGALQFGSVVPHEASLGGRLPPVGNAFELDRFLGQR
eukprot:3990653-Alexandrium_andersonii.AAC.1